MSELKVVKVLGAPDRYDKSEADKVIAYHKYKRCLAMARWCNRMFSSTFGKERYWQKWSRRWLELAQTLKEAK